MISAKCLFVFFIVFATCYASDHYPIKHKKKHHHCHGHHHLFYYLTFLAIKLKIVFFLGTIFTVSFVVGKIFALIKLTEYMKKKYHPHVETIEYSNPHGHFDYSSYPGPVSGDVGPKYYPSAPSDVSVDEPPADAYINERKGMTYNPLSQNSARNFNPNYNSSNLGLIMKSIQGVDITDMAFNEMGLKNEQCRKRFACRTQVNLKEYRMFQKGLNFLRDVSYDKYTPEETINTVEECDAKYNGCEEE